MPVTLHDVAAQAGLSIATVSRAINGLPVSAKARAKVEQAVAALGYVPNEAARTLRSDRSATVGVVFQNLRNTLGLELIDTISETLEAAGYALLIASARGDAGRYDMLIRRFLERRVDGLFCISPQGASPSLARCRAAGLPVIALFDRGGDYEELPLLTPSFQAAARDLAAELTGLGHRRIALVRSGPSPVLRAVAAGLRKAEIAPAEVDMQPGDSHRDLLARLLADPVTAVVAPLPVATGLLAAAKAVGVSIPDQISVVAVGDAAAIGQAERLGLSSLAINPEKLGRAAGEAMLGWLSGEAPAKLARVSAGAFSARRTTAPPPA